VPTRFLDRSSFHGPWATSVELSPDGRWLYVSGLGSASEDSRPPSIIDLRGLPSNEKSIDLPRGQRYLRFTGDSKWLVTMDESRTLHIHGLGESVVSVDHIVAGPYAETTLSGNTIVTIDDSHLLQHWRIENNALVNSRQDMPITLENISGLLASTDGRFVVVVGDKLFVMDLRHESPQSHLVDLDAGGYHKVSPSGDWFIGGPRGNFGLFLVNLRLLGNTYPTRILQIHGVEQNGARMDLPFSRDGRWLIAGAPNDAGELCDLSSADPINSAYKLGGVQFHDAEFSPNGDWFVLNNGDQVNFWTLRESDLLAFAASIAKRPLTHAEWKRLFPDEPYQETFENVVK